MLLSINPIPGHNGGRSRQHSPRFFTILVGLIFMASGVYAYHFMGRFLDRAVQAPAVVVSIVYESTNKKGRTHPVVRFTTAEGRELTVRTQEHHNVQPGDIVQLIYDPARPEILEITTLARAQKRRLLITVLSVALGAFVCLMGSGVIKLPG